MEHPPMGSSIKSTLSTEILEGAPKPAPYERPCLTAETLPNRIAFTSRLGTMRLTNPNSCGDDPTLRAVKYRPR